MSDNYLLRTDADNSVGHGHLIRCLALAAELNKKSRRAIFVLRHADSGARNLIAEHDYETHYLTTGHAYSSEIAELRQLNLPALNGAILDFSHAFTFSQVNQLPAYFTALRGIAPTIALLDGYRENSIVARLAAIDVDLLIAPYYAVDTTGSAACFKYLAGPGYFVFAPEYQALIGKPHRIDDQPDCILITFGGADPQRITLKALAGLAQLRDRTLQIRVAVGSSFDAGLVDDINRAAAARFHRCQILPAPSSLAKHMTWCDLAISGSGLTKYELALTGTPSIQISIDEPHSQINEEFIKAGSGIHLGVHTAVTAGRLAREIRTVLDNTDLRRQMSRLGQELTDGRGAQRIVDELQRANHASTNV